MVAAWCAANGRHAVSDEAVGRADLCPRSDPELDVTAERGRQRAGGERPNDPVDSRRFPARFVSEMFANEDIDTNNPRGLGPTGL